MREARRYDRKPTAKQLELMNEIKQGKTEAEAAKALGRNISTIKNDVNFLCDIFKVGSRKELAQKLKDLEGKTL